MDEGQIELRFVTQLLQLCWQMIMSEEFGLSSFCAGSEGSEKPFQRMQLPALKEH